MPTSDWTTIYDADLSGFPITEKVRSAFGPRNVTAGPVASPDAIGEIIAAIYAIETKMIAHSW